MTTLAAMREEAYRLYDEEAQNAWRGNGLTDAVPTLDTVEAASAEYDKEMAEAWKKA